MLCNYKEKGAKKCHEYLPTEDNKDTMSFKEKGQKVTVKFESSKAVCVEEIVCACIQTCFRSNFGTTVPRRLRRPC